MIVYVGTFSGSTEADGILVCRLHPETGALERLGAVRGLYNPSFLALHPSGRFLYAVERKVDQPGLETGAVTAFAVDPAGGALRLLNRQPSYGASPCHVSVHPSGRYVFAANFQSGHVAALPIAPDGSVGAATGVVQHERRGPLPSQAGPHAHFILSDPAGAFVLACDLGVDKVFVYRLDNGGRLMPNDPPHVALPPGSGPRHLAFHPNGRLVYVINQIASTLTVCAYDAARGALDPLQTLSTLADGYAGQHSAAHVLVHPSGRFVYGSNRGPDTVAVFAVDAASGRLRPVQHVATQGKSPRNFAIDPAGTLLLAANERSDTIVAFRIDPDTGRLTPTGATTPAPSPTCLVFAPQAS
jgi:6-phosphogluconolactonase